VDLNRGSNDLFGQMLMNELGFCCGLRSIHAYRSNDLLCGFCSFRVSAPPR
jgi:hypothetical protein